MFTLSSAAVNTQQGKRFTLTNHHGIIMSMGDDVLSGQLAAIKTHRKTARHVRFSRSRLDRYRADIETLSNQEGASHRDIALWLRTFKRVKIHATTVGRALKKWRNNSSVKTS